MVKGVEIEYLPAVHPGPPRIRPVVAGSFLVSELELLAARLHEWLLGDCEEMPFLPALASDYFQNTYGTSYRAQDYEDRLEVLLPMLFPAAPRILMVIPERHFAIRSSCAKAVLKETSDRVYWRRELVDTGGLEQELVGYRGPLQEKRWKEEALRLQYERELTVLAVFQAARAAKTAKYPDLLFFTQPGWPLSIRIR